MKLLKRKLEYYEKNGKRPFIRWLESLDLQTEYRIMEKLDRLRLGNMGDSKPIGQGISELRLHFGPGYRIYFGIDEEKVIILLCAGDKSTQNIDIKKAIKYWNSYLTR